jgi:glycosyltransferase involved in cell wall biosynthesis
MDCSILPSRNIRGIPFEGVPQALLEAMAAECPVVGSKTGGIMDIIEHGKTGLLSGPENPKDLADKILQTLGDQHQTLQRVEAAKGHVLKHHTLDTMGRNIIRIYRLHQVKQNRGRPDPLVY